MRVIAKAYGGEPLDRMATGEAPGVTYVLNPAGVSSEHIEPNSGIGFPNDCVFSYEASLFDSLRCAWESGDVEELNRLWQQAEPVQSSALA